MASVIRGASAPVLRHFRKETAALAVFWDYCSRTNKDNVATVSLEQLSSDTDYCVNSCAKARKYLIELQALEPVIGYVRPEWRDLPEDERKQLLNLDRSEYFRPTGYIVVDGERLSVLFNGSDDLSRDDRSKPQTSPDILSDLAQNDRSEPERKIIDLSPHQTSVGSDVSRVRAESLKDSKTLDQETLDLEEKKKEREKRLKDSREAWMKAITKLFPHIREDAYSYAGKYISFFQGKSPKEKGGEWDKWKIDNSQAAITAVHVYAFGHWWHTAHSGMTIRKCSTISEYFEEFMALGNLESRLLHAEKLLAKALNVPDIETRKIVEKSLVEAEIAAMQAELVKAAKLGSTRPEIVKYG